MNIFISYSHKNKDVCFQIAEMLEKMDEVNLWFDKGLIPGEEYRKTIAKKLKISDVVIVLISRDSVNSEWVIEELSYAKENRKKIVPVWIENTGLTTELDFMLHRFHSIFWFSRTTDQDFQNQLEAVLDRKPADKEDIFEGYGNEFSEKENTQIRNCLEKEINNEYSFCYKVENALLLGKAYLFGGPVSIDLDKARYYLKIAKYNGSIDASCYLITMQLDKLDWNTEDNNYKIYIDELIELADKGSIPAKLFLGNAYWYGRYSLPVSCEISASYYEECARKGNARAQYMMASNYYEGDGVPQDYDLAIMYANLSVEQKYVKAWRRWGKFYRDGRAVPQDFQKAMESYERGVQWGDYNCNNKIGDMYYTGKGVPVDYEKAVSYYSKALQAPVNGHRYALRKANAALALCYEMGHGVEKDLKKAADCYYLAYEYGDTDARDQYLDLQRRIVRKS